MRPDNSNIPSSTKISGINAIEIIKNNENDIIEHKEEKQKFTRNVIIMGVCLIIYWIILLLCYEKDKKFILKEIDEDYLFEKYNPMIAGCIQGSRDILARDIIAVILNLIDKGNIKLDLVDSTEKERYIYKIAKVEENEDKMDDIEKYIYNWVFKKGSSLSLAERLKQMPKEEDANIKFEKLNNMVEKNLATMGANKKAVPTATIRIQLSDDASPLITATMNDSSTPIYSSTTDDMLYLIVTDAPMYSDPDMKDYPVYKEYLDPNLFGNLIG